MTTKTLIESVQQGLKLVAGVEEEDKNEGLTRLRLVLEQNDENLTALGYDQVIFRELIKLAQFEKDKNLVDTLSLLEIYYFHDRRRWDEIAETLIYRVARSTDFEVCKHCLETISSLVDKFDDSIAKHSKQLLKIADLNQITSLNPIIVEMISKMETKLPKRKIM